ncbi:MAG: diguanylate cyclase [Xanthomonadales bacterium]|nr:hypothetical protein [Xanthomonadales bacterium]MCC6593129.1 diguanylate cyclase [Xanthomonadales bacterium]
MQTRAHRRKGQAVSALLWLLALVCLLWTWPPFGAKLALLLAAFAQLAWWQARRRGDRRMRLKAAAFEHSREGVLITDGARNIVMVNPAFAAITGYTETEVLGHNPRLLSSGRQGPEFYERMWQTIAREGSWHGELWNQRKNGELYAESVSITRIDDSDGEPLHYVSVFSDITSRKFAETEIQRLAHYDALTGLPNRALLTDRAQQALSLARRSQSTLALMFLDLDHFKHVNDSFGHRIGDLLLIAAAQRLQSAMREHDTVARQGGDEFVVILPDTDAEGAAVVADKLLRLMAEPFVVEGHELHVGASIGIAMFPRDGEDYDRLARAADGAMYRSKQAGRGRWSTAA